MTTKEEAMKKATKHMSPKWNGKHGVKVDMAAYIAARSKAEPEFKIAAEEARERHNISRKLAKLREASGLSQREVAEKLHTSQAAISRIEHADYEGHTISTLKRYLRAVGASMSISFRREA